MGQGVESSRLWPWFKNVMGIIDRSTSRYQVDELKGFGTLSAELDLGRIVRTST